MPAPTGVILTYWRISAYRPECAWWRSDITRQPGVRVWAGERDQEPPTDRHTRRRGRAIPRVQPPSDRWADPGLRVGVGAFRGRHQPVGGRRGAPHHWRPRDHARARRARSPLSARTDRGRASAGLPGDRARDCLLSLLVFL